MLDAMLRSFRDRMRHRGTNLHHQSSPRRVSPLLPDRDNKAPQREEESTPTTRSRSVNDFSTADELRQSLVSCDMQGSCCSDGGGDKTAWLFSKNDKILRGLLKTDGKGVEGTLVEEMTDLAGMDWVLENFDKATSEKQFLDHELRRLLVLKSFLILDTSEKDSFDEITRTAQEIFHTQYCMISLVDLGRQWFLSKQGLDDKQTPRNISFCTHGIQSKLDIFEVADATQDEHFKNNPLVTGPPHVQYYAGAPLISPEGYKIGMFCVVDTTPREPLTLVQRETLKNLAKQAVRTLVEHRRKMSAWFNNLVSTHFPDSILNDGSDDDTSDDDDDGYSSDDEGDNDQVGNDTEDDEFAAFVESTKKLSLKDLVGMLNKEAKEKQQQQQEEDRQQKEQKRPLESSSSSRRIMPDAYSSRPNKRQTKEPKSLRFSETAEVYLITSYKDLCDELWYDADEMDDIKWEKREEARWYRTRRDYMRAIQNVFEMPQDDDVKDHLKELIDAKVLNARGLENSVLDLMRDNRKKTRRAVVREQWRSTFGDKDDNAELLRKESLQYSRLSTRFAANLGEVDHIGALFSTVKNPYAIAQ